MSADRLLALAAIALALVGVGLALWVASGCGACGARRARCSRAARLPTWSSSRSACRRGRSTSSDGPTSSRRWSSGRASTSAAALQRVGLQRFDAYDGAEGLQSTALALLDAHGDGIVVSAIQDSDSARVYVKRVRAGSAADVALGPEELAAVAAARSGI